MDESTSQSQKLHLDPDPNEWFHSARRRQLEADLEGARATLAVAGLLPRAIEAWIRQQLAAEAPWDALTRSETIKAQEQQWRAKHEPESFGLLDAEVAVKLAVAPGCLHWADAQWGHRLENLFLQRKTELDRASCRLLRVTDKGLALELYHRIKAGEETFEILAQRFGEGPERLQAGLIPLQPLARLPMGLGNVLTRLEPGQLLQPTRLGNQIAVVQLEKWEPARFDEHSRRFLLSAELNQWLLAAGALALAHLRCMDRFQAILP
jgi:parvulin-like peptidyl-prolyl isomerase